MVDVCIKKLDLSMSCNEYPRSIHYLVFCYSISMGHRDQL
jgi:hypothetical protein